jgi:hypothetical protein
MKVPDAAFNRIKEKLWRIADDITWQTLPDPQKSGLYEDWIRDDDIGGVLLRYLDPGNIRVYLKDTIMKPYARERIKDFRPIQRLLMIADEARVAGTYVKPHGRRMGDGKVICWGLSRDWKAILFAVFERAYVLRAGIPFAAVIMYPTGKCQQPEYRRMIEVVAGRLGITHLIWIDE